MKDFFTTGLHKGILDLVCLLIPLINTKNKKMKSWTHHHALFSLSNTRNEKKNLNLSWWKSQLVPIKVLTFHYKSFDLPSWKCRPVNMKILTYYHKNLDLSSWKYRAVVMKNLDLVPSWKSRAVMVKISTCHKNLDLPSWKSRPVIMKILTLLHNKILIIHNTTQFFKGKSRTFIICLDRS